MLEGLIEALGFVVYLLLELGLSFYNNLVGMAAGMLGQDPAAWSSAGWAFTKNVNSIFLAIGGVLTVIFFLMGFCADSMDIRQDFRVENILRMFLKLSVAEFFVINSLTLVRELFALSTGVISKISGQGLTFAYQIPDEVYKLLNSPTENGMTGGSDALLLVVSILLALIFMLIAVGCGGFILYEAFQRFFKILLLVPYGTLANSTIAGNHMLAHSAEAFWKYAIATILEAVTMYMALALCAMIISSGSLQLVGQQTGTLYVVGWMLEMCLICWLTLGLVKGSETITQKALGL